MHEVSRRRFLTELGAGVAGCSLCGACGAAPVQAGARRKEALFYERLADKSVRCTLCPRRCVVPAGGRGYCGVRQNNGGRYDTLVYGWPCAMNLDPIEKKPFFHVYPGSRAFSIATVGCNIECKFCQNWDISQAEPDDVNPRLRYVGPDRIAALAAERKARTIAYTYNEPTVFYEYMADCARAARQRGLENVIVSNGFIADAPQKALFPEVRAIKIDLKAFTQKFYGEICDGFLQPVLDTLKRLADAGCWYEIVVLLIPTLNDGVDEIKRMTAWIVKELGPDVPVHFSRYSPRYKIRNIPPTPISTLRRARGIAREQGCHFVYLGNVPGDEGQHTYCPSCGEIAIKRYGYIILQNNIADGRCAACKTPIAGVWD